MLRVKNLNLIKKQNSILDNISFECMPGTITTLIGKSGAGKTSLLKCIGQLDRSYSGSLEFNAKDLKNYQFADKAEILGFVFQQFNLFPHMSILENCSNPLKIVKKYDSSKADDIAYKMLEKFGLNKFADTYPDRLSGGQQQRVAIARTLCFNPQIICLDEPSSALDPENTALLITTLKELASEGTTIIISTQDMPFARAITNMLIMLQEGKIVEKCDIKDIQSCTKIKEFMDFIS